MFSVKKLLDVCSICGSYVDIQDGVCRFCGTIVGKETDRKYEKAHDSRTYYYPKTRITDR